MTDQTIPENQSVSFDNPEQASTNFFWTYTTKEQVFNLQTTIRGVLTYDQIKAHIRSALEATAHVEELGGQAKQVGKPAETPAATLPTPTPIDEVLSEVAKNNAPVVPDNSGNSFTTVKLYCEKRNDKMYFKVKGGQWVKYGVTVWDEVLTAAGIPTGKLNPGDYNLPNYKATYTLKADGKPEKVIKLEKVA